MPAKNRKRKRVTVTKRILMAVDGSKSAYRAADYALALAKKLGSVVYFVHVVDTAPYPTYKEDISDYVEVQNSFEDRGKEILSNCLRKAKLKRVKGIHFS